MLLAERHLPDSKKPVARPPGRSTGNAMNQERTKPVRSAASNFPCPAPRRERADELRTWEIGGYFPSHFPRPARGLGKMNCHHGHIKALTHLDLSTPNLSAGQMNYITDRTDRAGTYLLTPGWETGRTNRFGAHRRNGTTVVSMPGFLAGRMNRRPSARFSASSSYFHARPQGRADERGPAPDGAAFPGGLSMPGRRAGRTNAMNISFRILSFSLFHARPQGRANEPERKPTPNSGYSRFPYPVRRPGRRTEPA